MHHRYQLVLASESPQRKTLLSHLDIPFIIMPSQVDENLKETDPYLYLQKVARLKAETVFHQIADQKKIENPFVLAADTVCVLNKEILQKPIDEQDAYKMLKKLSGAVHLVMTQCCFIWGKQAHFHSFMEVSKVFFLPIKDDVLKSYLKSQEYVGKAGSYAYQGRSQAFISHIEGSGSNIIGLPIANIYLEMQKVLKSNDVHSQFKKS